MTIAQTEHTNVEIIDGKEFVNPRPAIRHAIVLANVFTLLRAQAQDWTFLPEVEVRLRRLGSSDSIDQVCPDLIGMKKIDQPAGMIDAQYLLAPEFVCEVLSPGTTRRDRVVKMEAYRKSGVSLYWLIDPANRTVEIFRQDMPTRRWILDGVYSDEDSFYTTEFDEIDASQFWVGL